MNGPKILVILFSSNYLLKNSYMYAADVITKDVLRKRLLLIQSLYLKKSRYHHDHGFLLA